MDKVTDNKVVTVRLGAGQEWRVAMKGRSADLPFSTRQLAIEFARAYARLRRADTLQVFNEKGVLDHEEKVDFSFPQDKA